MTPRLCGLGPLPKFANGAGSTVFWTTGCALFKHGKNKEKAAEYIKALTYDMQIWQDFDCRHGERPSRPLPPYKSIYAGWDANKPEWMPDFVRPGARPARPAKAITNHLFGLQQFVIGKPYLGCLSEGRGNRRDGGDEEDRRSREGRNGPRLIKALAIDGTGACQLRHSGLSASERLAPACAGRTVPAVRTMSGCRRHD